MTRMSKEFSLVLLGAGLLTAGYFLWPEEDHEHRANEELQRHVGGATTSHHGGRMLGTMILLHSMRSSPMGRTGSSSPAISRGGFGSTGNSMSGIS